MTFRISKYKHNAWKAPQEHKNPQILFMRRISYKYFFFLSVGFGSLILSFRFLAKKLIEENIIIQKKVIIKMFFK